MYYIVCKNTSYCALYTSKSLVENEKKHLRTSLPALDQSARFCLTVSKALAKTSQTPESVRPRAPSGLIPKESQIVLNTRPAFSLIVDHALLKMSATPSSAALAESLNPSMSPVSNDHTAPNEFLMTSTARP